MPRSIPIVWVLLGASACLYDPDDRCSDGEILDAELVCVCAEGFGARYRSEVVVLTSEPEEPRPRDGCRACLATEVLDDEADICQCRFGYQRSPTGTCLPSYGAPCIDATACSPILTTSGLTVGACVPTSTTGAGFCTSTCQTSLDCPTTLPCSMTQGLCLPEGL